MFNRMQILCAAAYSFAGLVALSGTATAGDAPGMIGHNFVTPPSVQHNPHATSKLCKIGGVWTSEYAATITLAGNKGKKGTYTYGTGCTWKVKTSGLTQAGFNATMTPEKTAACDGYQCFSEALQFQGSCDSVAGTFSNCDGGGGDDSWTKD
jgi:hypothetical protein